MMIDLRIQAPVVLAHKLAGVSPFAIPESGSVPLYAGLSSWPGVPPVPAGIDLDAWTEVSLGAQMGLNCLVSRVTFGDDAALATLPAYFAAATSQGGFTIAPGLDRGDSILTVNDVVNWINGISRDAGWMTIQGKYAVWCYGGGDPSFWSEVAAACLDCYLLIDDAWFVAQPFTDWGKITQTFAFGSIFSTRPTRNPALSLAIQRRQLLADVWSVMPCPITRGGISSAQAILDDYRDEGAFGAISITPWFDPDLTDSLLPSKYLVDFWAEWCDGTFGIAAAPDDAPAPMQMFVDPAGDNSYDGLSATFTTGSHGPKATIEGARDAIRVLIAGDNLPPIGIDVNIAPGTYPREGAFALGQEDSGTQNCPIRYISTSPRSAICDAGVAVEWSDLNDAATGFLTGVVSNTILPLLKMADLSSLGVNPGASAFPQSTYVGNHPSTAIELFVAGNRQTCARWPKKEVGYALATGGVNSLNLFADLSTLRAPSATPDVWLVGFPGGFNWGLVSDAVTINHGLNKLTITKDIHNTWKAGDRFYLKNSLADLSEPGEYFVDKTNELLYWYPSAPLDSPSFISGNQTGAVIEMTDCSYVTLEGLTVRQGRSDGILVTGCDHIHLNNLLVDNCGGSGIIVSGGSHVTIDKKTIVRNMGESGVLVTGGDVPSLTSSSHLVTQTFIRDFGLIMPSSRPGILLDGCGNAAVNNTIERCPHIAFLLKGCNHVVDFNDMVDACMDSGDAGAFYASGTDPAERGNRLHGNRVLRCYNRIGGAGNSIWAYYLDGRASGFDLFGNIAEDCDTAYFINGGRDNTVANCIGKGVTKMFQVNDSSGSATLWPLLTYLTAVNWQADPWLTAFPKVAAMSAFQPFTLGGDQMWPQGNLFDNNAGLGVTTQLEINTAHGVHAANPPTGARDAIGYVSNQFAVSGLFVDEDAGDYTPLPGSALALAGFVPVQQSACGVQL